MLLWAVALLLATAAAIAQVWTHQRAIDYSYRISKAAKRRTELLEQNRRLRVELALLKDPARIAREAARRSGMRPPEPEQVRRLSWPERRGRR